MPGRQLMPERCWARVDVAGEQVGLDLTVAVTGHPLAFEYMIV